MLLRVRNLLETKFLHDELENRNRTLDDKVRGRTQELLAAEIEILERLTLAAEYRDDDTGKHTKRVGEMSALLAERLNHPGDFAELIQLHGRHVASRRHPAR